MIIVQKGESKYDTMLNIVLNPNELTCLLGILALLDQSLFWCS